MWANASAVIGNKEDDYIKSVTVGQNGNMLLAGVTNSFGAGMDDVLLVKLDTIYPNQDTVKYEYEDMIPLNVKKEVINNNFNIYPNPVRNQFQLISDVPFAIYKINIYDLFGREVPVIRFNNMIFDISELKRGTYILQAIDNDGRIFSEKIIKL